MPQSSSEIIEALIELGIEPDMAVLATRADEVNAGSASGDEFIKPGEWRTWREGETLRTAQVFIGNPAGTLTLQKEFHPGQNIFRQWMEIKALEEVHVDSIAPAVISFMEDDHFTTLHTIAGVQQQGGWRPDTGEYRSFRLEHAPLVPEVIKESGERSTWWEYPWAAITGDDVARGGILLAFEYGGQWKFTADSGSARFETVGIEPVIATGETWISPSVWIGTFTGDLDSAAATLHRYVREVVTPPAPDDFPWVQYNTWYAFYCNLDEQELLAEADIAASLGIDVFYVDAGWWIGNPRRRDRFTSGLGNWIENREKFPHGLSWFADQIRAKGLHFGIWVEPERVDLRTVHTGTWKDQWIARNDQGYIRCPWPSDTDSAWLCFGHDGTQRWASEWIATLVESLGVRWLKWDSNYWGVCTDPNHSHGTSDGEAAQLAGVYAVMDDLRARFPDLIIENCAGGGTRMDFALTRHTHTAWMSDASEPHFRTRFHSAGASYAYPPEMLNAWITESEHENVNGQQLPDAVWRAIIRSRMLGAVGFSCQLHTWNETTRDIARQEIAFYKQHLRSMIRSGTFHHLLPQPVISNEVFQTPDVWEAYQLDSTDRTSLAILGFRNASPEQHITVHPAVIDTAATYQIVRENDSPETVPGSQLLKQGITLQTGLLASDRVMLHRFPGQ